MPIPETTSAGSFAHIQGGTLVRFGESKTWREISLWIKSLQRVVDLLPLPSESEPFLARTFSSEVEFKKQKSAHGNAAPKTRAGF
jgi:hypothetical protein